MESKSLSKLIRETMIKNLVRLEEERQIVLEQYFPEPSLKRAKFEDGMDKYIQYVESFIKDATIDDKLNIYCPFVTIGSDVEVIDLEDNEVYIFRIISPLIDETLKDIDCISYLSPIGEALLLRKTNEEFQIKVPNGVINYRVNSIWIMDE
ncbi:transcription elongation factor GreAB [Clostridium bovifaecis]|uniref:Transcription elongation factor GreAB n=1 Tax=Clostridium bovifaecis TaxID=2184719 RepID=A0A6I6EUR3_9CLOT|nr:transcription elongation factor GreAB [Clostridium bovifaecis]